MESAADDRADVRVLPPVLFLVSLCVGLLLGWLAPLRILSAEHPRLPLALGLTALAFGLGAVAWSLVWMRRTEQDPDPRKPTPSLIAAGPFRFSRNPIYLGMALLEAGIGLAIGNAWLLLLVPPTIAILVRTVVEREEAYLARKFGEPYARYCEQVRRWL